MFFSPTLIVLWLRVVVVVTCFLCFLFCFDWFIYNILNIWTILMLFSEWNGASYLNVNASAAWIYIYLFCVWFVSFSAYVDWIKSNLYRNLYLVALSCWFVIFDWIIVYTLHGCWIIWKMKRYYQANTWKVLRNKNSTYLW